MQEMNETNQKHRTRNTISFVVATVLAAFGFAGQLFVEATMPVIGASWFPQACILAAVILYIQGFVVEAMAIRDAKQKIHQMKTGQETGNEESQHGTGG
jgi:hypothetical protein